MPGAGSSLTQVLYNGSVQFDSPILGVILTDANLIASDIDPGLAPSPVTCRVTPSRGLEFGANADRITIDTAQNHHLPVRRPDDDGSDPGDHTRRRRQLPRPG